MEMVKLLIRMYKRCFVFGEKQDDELLSYEDDEVLSSPLMTEEDVKQHLLNTLPGPVIGTCPQKS